MPESKLKKFLQDCCVLFITLFSVSCTNTESENILPETDEPIGFGVAMSTTGRTLITDESQMGSFKVWGWRTPTNQPTNAIQEFDAVTLTYDEEVLHHWSYTPIKSWIMYNSYNFYALYPAATYDVIYNNNTFTINNYNANAQEDFLLAKKEDHQFPDDGATVHLSFEHLLSHISIKLKKADDEEGTITVTGIDLANLNVIANYSTSNGDYGGWNNWTRKTDTSFNLGNDGVTLTGDLQICGEGIFVIPQEISDEMKFYIYYTYTPKSAQEAQAMTPLEIDIPNTMSITTEGGTKELSYWPNGIKIAYSGTVSLGKIEFSTPKVEEWGQKQSSGTIIIK